MFELLICKKTFLIWNVKLWNLSIITFYLSRNVQPQLQEIINVNILK